MSDRDDRAEFAIDVVALDDVGDATSGWVGWAVAADGTQWPWWWSPAGNDAEQGCRGPRCAPHEQDGPYLVPRLALCGHPTRHGGPCRRRVHGPGACWQHERIDRQRRQHSNDGGSR